jgi:hypothetical protein
LPTPPFWLAMAMILPIPFDPREPRLGCYTQIIAYVVQKYTYHSREARMPVQR